MLAELPDGTLMQRAAAGLAASIADFAGRVYGVRILLLIGSGDNGGDALFAGAMLARRGALVQALLLGEAAHSSGLAALRQAGGRVVSAVERRPDLVVDGIVGIGGRPGLRPEAAAVVKALAGIATVSVDTPSGVGVDDGVVDGACVHADLTVTFGCLKPVHLLDPDGVCGVVELVDIGLELPAPSITSLQEVSLQVASTAHKYTRGVVGIDTGSTSYPGAGVLSVAGALAGPAGMVRYAGSAREQVLQAHPEAVPGRGRVQAWVVGSGGGDDAAQALRAALADGVPVVVDADALAFAEPGCDMVLTPHAGELARMLAVPRETIEAEPLRWAQAAAERWQAVVLLKGRRTVIAHPDGRLRINTTGTPHLATAGSGDVLAGLIGSLLASGLSPFDAASCGAWLHGAAAQTIGGPLVASELAVAIRHLR